MRPSRRAHADACRHNLALLLREQGRTAEAAAQMRLLVAAFRDTLGAGHPTTLAAVDNLAVALDELGRLGEAAALKREAVAGFRAAVGPAHPDTLIAAHNLALTLLEQGRRLRQG